MQGTASEATLTALLSAKARAVEKFENENNEEKLAEFKSKLVAYTSSQAHCSIERAGLLADVIVRSLETDEDFSLRGQTLAEVTFFLWGHPDIISVLGSIFAQPNYSYLIFFQ